MFQNCLFRSLRPRAVAFKSGGQGSTVKKSLAGRLWLEQLEERTTPSVVLGVSVDGMNTTNNSCNCQPPDPIAAAGPNHIVEMVNTAIEVFNKDGTVASAPQSTLSFFSNHIHANQSDPFVLYDELGGKFVAGMLDYSSSNASNYVDFATGVDSASGITWTLHSPYASGEGRKFLDYPRVGYNADAYFIEGNMFRGGFRNVQVITINKSTLNIVSRHDDSSLFTLTPAAMHGALTGGPEYFVESHYNGGSNINIVAETNVLSSTPTFTTTSVGVTAYTQGGSPQQPSGTIASFDARIFNAAFRGGHLVAAHQGGQNGSSTPVHAIWYDFLVATVGSTTMATLNQEEFLPAATSTTSTFMPSVDINTAGSIGLNYDESSSTEFWSMYVTERITTDALGTMETPVLAKAGTANTSDSRVGDYSAISVDPSDGLTFWAANEYQGSDFWDTHVASFKSSVPGASPITIAWPTTSSQPAPNLPAMLVQDPPTNTDMVALNQPAGSQDATDMVSGVSASAISALESFWADARNWDFPTLQF